MGTPHGGEDRRPHGPVQQGSSGPVPQGPTGAGPQGPTGPGRSPRTDNPTPLIALGVVVIAVCVVVLFVLSGRDGSDVARLQVGDCVPAEADGAVSCTDAAATYRVVDVRDGVAQADTPTACGAVPGVVAFGWEGEEGAAGTAYCLGTV